MVIIKSCNRKLQTIDLTFVLQKPYEQDSLVESLANEIPVYLSFLDTSAWHLKFCWLVFTRSSAKNMDKSEILIKLSAFKNEYNIRKKGTLALMIYLSRIAKKMALPLNPEMLITRGSGQILGLGKAPVQRVLFEYGLNEILAEEGGRTNRTNIKVMRGYIALLNSFQIEIEIEIEILEIIEKWWIEQVKEYFANNNANSGSKYNKPFILKLDTSSSFQTVIQNLLDQAKNRKKQANDLSYQDIVLKHLIGAKLELKLPELNISHKSFTLTNPCSVEDVDFLINESILHIVYAPDEDLIRKCKHNLEMELKPIVFTIGDGVIATKELASYAGILSRIDIIDASEFLAANLHILSVFKTSSHSPILFKLIEIYNRIITTHETDPSLRIILA